MDPDADHGVIDKSKLRASPLISDDEGRPPPFSLVIGRYTPEHGDIRSVGKPPQKLVLVKTLKTDLL